VRDRIEYRKGRLVEDESPGNPFELFTMWINEAASTGATEPTAMCLSTVGEGERPSSRIVLLRRYDESGFVFFTNYLSRKSQEIARNQFACLNFYWPELERQIRIEGQISQVESSASDDYWDSRPYESQLASFASPQSQVVPSREHLVALVDQARATHPATVPRPAHWGGFLLAPDRIEFWQGGGARLHDRICYTSQERDWIRERLAP
jgi:pyridoxamine 5'-phosphate oxidase